jgi:hypothetical protein
MVTVIPDIVGLGGLFGKMDAPLIEVVVEPLSKVDNFRNDSGPFWLKSRFR